MTAMVGEGRVSSTAVVVGVLIASVVVASLLAVQAINAARSRQAVSDAMLRQYAQLAAWEYSQEARKAITDRLVTTLNLVAHPKQGMTHRDCDCMGVNEVEHWFNVAPGGRAVPRDTPLPASVQAAVDAMLAAPRPGPAESTMLGALDAARFIVVKPEPHLGADVTHIGLVARVASLGPLLERSYRHTTLLPPIVAGGRDSHELVDLRVHDAGGDAIFASTATARGPQEIEAGLLQDDAMGLRVIASMTPEFVSTLGPEHGGGPNGTLIIGLVIVNALMVTIGLWQLARERELARLRSDFVAGVSHELRTPLAQIRMFTDTLLLDRIRTPAEGRRALEIIAQETRRLGQLVENVLYFHRHQRAPQAPPSEPLDLSTLVMEVADGFKPLAASRRIGIAVRTPVGEVIVDANADGLRQVLLNLLDNAVKFGPSDDTIDVALSVEAGAARIAVEDRGAGVPLADRRRIFEQFERGRSAGHAGGAGIGLAVVQQIVRAHRGTVAVEEAAAGGARFVVSLPLVDDEPRETPVSLAG
jgi:signal transduction histidine kinase